LDLHAQPFQCDGDFILSLTNQSPSKLFKLDIMSNGVVDFKELSMGTTDKFINAIGYRTTDNYVYGIDPNKHELYRIDATGNATYITTPDLTPQTIYWAGAITPDGEELLLIGKRNGWICTCDFSRVNLNDYSVTTTTFPNGFPLDVSVTDIAFDPLSGKLYGFDGIDNRFVIIDIEEGKVDQASFTPSETIEGLGALFFDSFGDLYGYGSKVGSDVSNTLFKIDKATGAVLSEAIGPETTNQDGCACSNNIDLRKRVFPEIAYACTEVQYVFEISNTSRSPQFNASFNDILPEDFTIKEIVYNPYNGNVLSGVGTNVLHIGAMEIPTGIDSIIIRVALGPNTRGFYGNQASINNLPESLGYSALSDNPLTLAKDDSTILFIKPLDVNLQLDTIGLCLTDTIILDASTDGVTYKWDDGSTNSSRSISEQGVYHVTISLGCASASDTVVVLDEFLKLELGQDQEIVLGDSILIQPDIRAYGELKYSWTDPLGNSLSCLNCPSPYASPTSNLTYHLRIMDEFGCMAEDSIGVSLYINRQLYVPSVFSPNNDGVNDEFYVYGDSKARILTFQIFDRWGNKVFEQFGGEINDSNQGWDGTFKEQELAPAIFAYSSEIEFADGVVTQLRGFVTLIK
jgi:gliding motility-associated-like protein